MICCENVVDVALFHHIQLCEISICVHRVHDVCWISILMQGMITHQRKINADYNCSV